MADETLRAAGLRVVRGVELGRRPDAAGAGTTSCTGRDANWWGFGPGAHSHVSGVRWWNVKHPARYAAHARVGREPGRRPRDARRRRRGYTERVMLGVRMREGLRRVRADRAGARPSPQLAGWGLVDPRARRGRPRRAHPARPAAWPTPWSANSSPDAPIVTRLRDAPIGRTTSRTTRRSDARSALRVNATESLPPTVIVAVPLRATATVGPEQVPCETRTVDHVAVRAAGQAGLHGDGPRVGVRCSSRRSRAPRVNAIRLSPSSYQLRSGARPT